MLIESLRLRDFRNAADLRLVPGQRINLLVGRNAQGKTNIIEAIGLLSTGQSFRAPDFRDMIRWDREAAEVSARAICAAGSDELKINIDVRRKLFTRNEKRVTSKAPSNFFTVLFAPEEILLLKGPPAGRRRYIDSLIFQLSQPHRNHAMQYDKVMRQRNRLLQDIRLSESARTTGLRPWDEQLAELGSRIIVARNDWCGRINSLLPDRYRSIAPEEGYARFAYAPHCGQRALEKGLEGVMERLREQLEERRKDELVRGVSLVGPHRDDLEAEIGPSRVKHFGSQGQHRSFVLALKIAEMDLLREAAGGEEPILLLDDVASELDPERNRYFFEGLRAARGQVFITATSEADIKLPAGSEMTI
ncbi:MAG: DNA replication/repair protein RecF, partial [bacterium]